MKISLLTLLMFVCLSAGAQNYYFSNSGSDSNGCSIGSPCRTLAKANTLNGSKHFAKGSTFTGTLTPHANETVDGYGTGANPVFSGFETLSGWTNNGDGTWSVVDFNLPTTMIFMVTLNGSQALMGRFPRTSYQTYNSYTINTSITSVTTPPTYNGMASYVVLKKNKYTLDRYPITNVTGNLITYAGGTGGTTDRTQGSGYFFENAPKYCVQLGDWAYEPTLHKLTMYFGAANPTSYVVKASATTSGLTGSAANVTVNGIDFTGYASFGVKVVSAANATVENCTFSYIGNSGLNAFGSSNFTLQNCTFLYCNNGGWEFDQLTNGNILNNTLKHIGMIPGLGQSLDQSTEGSYEAGTVFGNASTNYTISGNFIDSCGYNGLRYQGQNITVHNNYVNYACAILADGACYYHHGNNSTLSPQGTINVTNNIGTNAIGNADGTVDGKQLGVIYYSDDGSVDMNYTGNTGAYATQAVFYIHNSQRISITGNTAYGSAIGISMTHDGILLIGLIRQITINNNQIISTTTAQKSISLLSLASNASAGDLTLWGTATGNKYANTTLNTSSFYSSIYPGGTSRSYTLSQWQTATTHDGGSTYTSVGQPSLFFTNPISATYSLSGNYADLSGTAYAPGTHSLGNYTGLYLIFTSPPLVPAPNISYTPSVNTYPLGSAISPLSPVNTGGAITGSYHISATLPLGLSFSTSTGAISGTPLALSGAVVYRVDVGNGTGRDTTALTISVMDVAPHISYVTPRILYTGISYSLIPNNTGGASTSWGITPSLPSGLGFSTTTGWITGTPVSPHSATSYTVTATNGSGVSHTTITITLARRGRVGVAKGRVATRRVN